MDYNTSISNVAFEIRNVNLSILEAAKDYWIGIGNKDCPKELPSLKIHKGLAYRVSSRAFSFTEKQLNILIEIARSEIHANLSKNERAKERHLNNINALKNSLDSRFLV